MKLTKQGVRDLNHLKGKPSGIPVKFGGPLIQTCKHRRQKHLLSGSSYCEACGERLDPDLYTPGPDPDYDA